VRALGVVVVNPERHRGERLLEVFYSLGHTSSLFKRGDPLPTHSRPGAGSASAQLDAESAGDFGKMLGPELSPVVVAKDDRWSRSAP
jgi:hypothetical protein